MASVFCVGLGELLTFAAMVLGILINVGQISDNIVARNLYYTSLDTTGFEASIRTIANQNNVNVNSIYAPDQAAPELDGNGLKYQYRWGLYSFCGGSEDFKTIACDRRSFGYSYEPLNVLEQDVNSDLRQFVGEVAPNSVFSDQGYLSRYTNAANYIIFVATVVIGVGFLIAFLSHRFAFFLAALLALAGAALFLVGAAIWTALIYRTRDAVNGNSSAAGLEVRYGNAIWMAWAAGGASVLSVIPLLVACVAGRRSKY